MGQEQDMTNAARIRILSVDDHPLFREGVGSIINCQADMSLAGTASNGREGIEAFRALRPDVTLTDLRLPDVSVSSTALRYRCGSTIELTSSAATNATPAPVRPATRSNASVNAEDTPR